jgi:predicted O-methyltransferase YrrM
MSFKESQVHPHHAAERADLYHAFDSGSIEVEFGNLLTALTVAWKPDLILETGTFHGIGARFLADGVRINGFGHVISLEMMGEIAVAARRNLAGYDSVTVVETESTAWLKTYAGPPFQFAVIDSDLRTRIEELRILRDRGLLKGLAFVHDTSRLRCSSGFSDWPEYPEALDALGLSGVECPFSRGWRLFQMGAAPEMLGMTRVPS